MGLPKIEIEFKAKATTAISRSKNGIVAVILRDSTKTGDEFTSYSYNDETEIVKAHLTTKNLDILNKAFLGAPKRVLVERIGDGDTYDDALARLKNKKWNWLAIPSLTEDEVEDVANWIIAQRAAKKTFKAVLPNYEADNEGIVNFATDGIIAGTKSYTTAEYCVRIAGLLAGMSLTDSATYKVLSEVSGITESTTPDDDIDNGKFILVNDGENIKVGRAVTSLTTVSDSKTEDMKKIKIVEGMDLIRDDIKTSFENNYIGENNSYDNKMLFVAAVNQYFNELVNQGVLYDEGENSADIDIEAQKAWLSEKYDISEWSDAQIRQAKTGSQMFMMANVAFADAVEDLKFGISME